MKKLLLVLFCLISMVIHGMAQSDSTHLTLFAWKLDNHFTKSLEVPLDTNLTNFQHFNPIANMYPAPAYLGNLGQAIMSNYIPERAFDNDFIFLNHFNKYLKNYENTSYFNTRSPFTKLIYSTGGGKAKQEQFFSVLHTQNIKPYFNVGLSFDLFSSEGQYKFQRSKISTFGFYSSFEKEIYTAYFSLNYNSLKYAHNGGLVSDTLLTNPDYATENIPVRLPDGVNTFTKDFNMRLVQKVSLSDLLSLVFKGSMDSAEIEVKDVRFFSPENLNRSGGYLTHSFAIERTSRSFSFQSPLEQSFFNDIYIDSTKTGDSTSLFKIRNTIQLEIHPNPNRKFRFGMHAGIAHEFSKYSIPALGVFSGYTSDQEGLNNLFLQGGIDGGIGKQFNLLATGKLFLLGYNATDVDLNGEITGNIDLAKQTFLLKLSAQLKRQRPSFLYQKYFSNHIRWDFYDNNQLNPVNSTLIQGSLSHTQSFIEGGFYYGLFDNYLYFNSFGVPEQLASPINFLGIFLNKTVNVWKFVSINKLNYQTSSNKDIVPLPDISFTTSTFFHTYLVKNVLNMQIGADVTFFTKYYGYSYMPANEQFTIQYNVQIGNYPFVDVFINFKLKRTRISLRYDHVNSGLAGYGYFMAVHYPMPVRMLKFGVSWTFYD